MNQKACSPNLWSNIVGLIPKTRVEQCSHDSLDGLPNLWLPPLAKLEFEKASKDGCIL